MVTNMTRFSAISSLDLERMQTCYRNNKTPLRISILVISRFLQIAATILNRLSSIEKGDENLGILYVLNTSSSNTVLVCLFGKSFPFIDSLYKNSKFISFIISLSISLLSLSLFISLSLFHVLDLLLF